MEKTTEAIAEKKASASKPEAEAKPEPHRLRHFLEGKPRHHGRALLAMNPKLTLDSEGDAEFFAAALKLALKARL